MKMEMDSGQEMKIDFELNVPKSNSAQFQADRSFTGGLSSEYLGNTCEQIKCSVKRCTNSFSIKPE